MKVHGEMTIKKNEMKSGLLLRIMLPCIFLCMALDIDAQSNLIPTTAISNMPTVTIKDMNLERNDFAILKSVSASAVVKSDNKRSGRTIYEENGEFKLVYDIIRDDGVRYLEYDTCEGVIRLGYLGNTNIYSSDSYFIPAEEIVRRLALYRLISLAKEYGADALFEPTITTSATSEKKTLIYKSEATAKLIKIINN